jgi:hypothetical protein
MARTRKHSGGKPEIILDEEKVYELAKLGCSIREVAHYFGCSRDVIERKYLHILQKGKAETIAAIKRAQLQLALEQNNTKMLIHLGKVLCEQVESKQVFVSTDTAPDGIDFEVINND